MTRAIEVGEILRLSIEHAARFRRDFETGRADRQRRLGRLLLRRAARLAVHGVRVPARAAADHHDSKDGQRLRHRIPLAQIAGPHGDRVDAACSFIVDLIRAYIAAAPSLLCLHGAAAEFAGRLVVFPTPYRSGKSTLTAYLAAAGVRVYADDILPSRRTATWASLRASCRGCACPCRTGQAPLSAAISTAGGGRATVATCTST